MNLGFVAATLSFLMVFAASAAPIPLYDLYSRTDGLSYSDLSLAAVVYFVGAVTALLIFGRISDHLGRKPVAFLTFGIAASASVILLNVNSAAPFICGRFLLGLSSGLASSAIASYVVDSASSLPRWMPAAVVSNSPMVGLTLGALVSGALVQYGPYPRTLSYVVVLLGLALCTALMFLGRETVARKPGLMASLRPKFSVPQAERRIFPLAACAFIATWAMGGFNLAFGPMIAVNQLGSNSAFMAAVVFSSYLLPNAIGGPLSARLTPADAQRFGMVVYTMAVMGMLFSLKHSMMTGFLASSVLAGTSQGAVLTGSIRSLLKDVTPQERAGVLSLIYATSYTGAAVPNLIAGEMSHFTDLFHIAVFYSAIAVFACIIILLFARNSQEEVLAIEESGAT